MPASATTPAAALWSTQHAGGAQSYSIDYGNSPNGASGSLQAGTAVDASHLPGQRAGHRRLGTPQTYAYQGGNGIVRLQGASGAFEGGQVAGEKLAGPTLPETETDFLGVSTAYTWDLSRQLKVATTEALGRPEAQTTSIEWHPSFRLPVQHHRSRAQYRLQLRQPRQQAQRNHHRFGHRPSPHVAVDVQRPGAGKRP